MLAVASASMTTAYIAQADMTHDADTRPPGWLEVNVGEAFTIALPPGMKRQPSHGQDSLAGEYRSPDLRLRYDYGRYTGRIADVGTDDFSSEKVSIDGRTATLASWRDTSRERPFVLTAHFERVTARGSEEEEGPDPIRLEVSIDARSRDARERALLILRSIRFR